MALEKFERQQAPDWPAVTIRKNGTLCLNRKAIDEFNIGAMRFATLHYDENEKLLGIKPETDNKDPSTFKVSKEKGRTFTIGCQAFLKAAKVSYWQGSKMLKAE